jgi:hypothetical protein
MLSSIYKNIEVFLHFKLSKPYLMLWFIFQVIFETIPGGWLGGGLAGQW